MSAIRLRKEYVAPLTPIGVEMGRHKRIYEIPQMLQYEKEIAFFIANKLPRAAFEEYLLDVKNTEVDESVLLKMWSKVSGRMILGRILFDDEFLASLDKSEMLDLAARYAREIKL